MEIGEGEGYEYEYEGRGERKAKGATHSVDQANIFPRDVLMRRKIDDGVSQ
jgi:hypothetical protein